MRPIRSTMNTKWLKAALLPGLAGAGVFLAAAGAFGQNSPAVVKATMMLGSDAVHSGAATEVAVVAQVAPGYHINDHHPSLDYLIPTELNFDPSKEFSLSQVVYPAGKPEKFIFSEKPLSVYAGQFIIRAGLRAARGLPPGSYLLRAKLAYQACNDHACLPPVNLPLTLKVRVAAPGARLRRTNADVFRKPG